MTLGQVLALRDGGAQVLDTRDPNDFAAAHLEGSINIGLGGQFATWAGTILSRERPIVLIANPGRERESVLRRDASGSIMLRATWTEACWAFTRNRS